MRRWTEETDRKAEELYATFAEAKIRRYQDLAQQQMGMAYRQRNADAYADLEAMHNALSAEMRRRLNAGTDPRRPRIRRKRKEDG